MFPVTIRAQSQKAGIQILVEAGTYYFRVRYVDSNSEWGPWSDVQGFSVNPMPPKLSTPVHNAVISDRIPEAGVKLVWEPGIALSKYKLEIRDASGTILERSVDTNQYSWMPTASGVFKWRVGFKGIGTTDWGGYQTFRVRASALPENRELIQQVARIVKSKIQEGDSVGIDASSGFTLWPVLRLGQTLINHSVDEKDASVSESETVTAGVGGIDLRWSAGASKSDWIIHGNLGVEVFRQVVNQNAHLLPVGFFRLNFTRSAGRWYFGPFLQYSIRKNILFYSTTTPTVNENAFLLRHGAGGGFQVTRRAGDVNYFSLSGLVRYDMGGTYSTELVNAKPVERTLGAEGSLGFARPLSSAILFEARLRVLKDKQLWIPEAPSTERSSFSNLFIIFDLGLGYKF